MQVEDWYSLIYSAKNNNKARERNQSLYLQTSNKMYILSSFGFSQYVHMLLLIMQFFISSQRLPQHERSHVEHLNFVGII